MNATMIATNTAFWRDRSVLVTGCTGFLGGWLAEWLSDAGASVVGLVRDGVPYSRIVREGIVGRIATVLGDLEDYALLERILGEYEVVTVFHLAAQTLVGIANRNPVSTFETNIRGTWQLLEACRRSPLVRQVIIASSDKAYGAQQTLPYTEETPLSGSHPYDVSKSCADLIAQSYALSFGLPVAITRCGNFYGGGDLNFNRIVPGTVRSLLRGESPIIRSDGSYIRDYLYIEDAVCAYVLLAERLAQDPSLTGEAFNFSCEQQITVLELVSAIARAVGRADIEPRVLFGATNEIRDQFLSAAKASRVLGWQPQFSLDEGLCRTVAWYAKYLNVSWPAQQRMEVHA